MLLPPCPVVQLSQLEQALGHEHGDEAIEQHPERH